MAKIFSEEENKKWLADMPKKSIAVKAIIKSNKGNILLVKPNYKNTWQFPGGGAEAGEEPKNALIRELKEELDLNFAPHELKIIGTVFRQEHDNLILIYKYSKDLQEDNPLTLQDDEIEDYKFEKPGAIADQLSYYYKDFWASYVAK